MYLHNQLTSESKSSGEKKEYSYDDFGNRKEMKVTYSGDENRSVTYTYDENNRLLNENAVYSDRTEIVDYTYDYNGNLTDKFYGVSNSDTSTGTSLGMCLVNSDQDSYERYTYDTLNQLVMFEAGTTTAEYSYRADGLRYSKSVNDDTTYFGWSGNNVNAEYDENGETVASYSRGVGLIKNSDNLYYLSDAHGDVV